MSDLASAHASLAELRGGPLEAVGGTLAYDQRWPPLAITAKLISALDANGVTYCHWKSTNKLATALRGEQGVDLDLLVDNHDSAKIHHVLAGLGFVAKRAGAAAFTPGRQGFVGLDHETGRQIYIDMHFTMITGPKMFRRYVLPYSHILLRDRRRCDRTGVYVPDPAQEALVLLWRASLKIDGRAYIKAWLGRRHFSEDWTEQLAALLQKTTLKEIRAQAEEWSNAEVAGATGRAIESQGAFGDLVRLRNRLSPFLKEWRAYTAWHTLLLISFIKLSRQAKTINAALGRFLFPIVPQSPEKGGLFVVVIGPDTSGKSTLTKALSAWLCWKFCVERVYLGAGEGSSSRLRRALMLIRRGWPHAPRSKGSNGGGNVARRDRGVVRATGHNMYQVLYALALAREKQVKLRRAWRARNQGFIILADRCPQTDVMGFNDGPWLSGYKDHKNMILRRLAVWEDRVYRSMSHRPPDLVIRLAVTPEVALRRDPSLTADYVERRIAAVRAIRFPAGVGIVDVDGTRELAEVQRAAKIAIWQRL